MTASTRAHLVPEAALFEPRWSEARPSGPLARPLAGGPSRRRRERVDGNRLIERVCAALLVALARLVTGAREDWRGCAPDTRPRVYFANHRSHADFVLIWTVLPAVRRGLTRPVAGADYWLAGRIRRFVGGRVFRAILIDRGPATCATDAVSAMTAALDQRLSLVVFPEGTRNTTDEPLLPFKSGLYHLARARPDVELVPVWIENLDRIMPKGALLPIPLLCTVRFGAPMTLAEREDKAQFLERCRRVLLALAPHRGSGR
jgi:1-acyl-sn-glycerol-3-phosphate acyltransferase